VWILAYGLSYLTYTPAQLNKAGRQQWKPDFQQTGVGSQKEEAGMYYMLFYDYVDDYLERRDAFREAHLAWANQALQSGELKMAGAFTERPYSAALIFDVDDISVIERFVEHDPTYKAAW
jgi:uncharacterized protein YciI